jgi:glutathione peroxidase
MAFSLSQLAHAECEGLLDQSMKRLHSTESIDLCKEYAGKPLVIVNTASHCGFTPQFTALEQIYQKYQSKGIGFLGVSSNSFFQAAASEEQAAQVCYLNYGVSFPMTAPVDVTGADAHPLFLELTRQSAAPKWNFYKYVVDKDGKVVGRFGSTVKPDSKKITALLDQLGSLD